MTKVQRWESATSLTMMVLSLAWLVLASWYVVDGPEDGGRSWLRIGMFVIWALFLIDYLVRLLLSEIKHDFVKRSLLDLGSVLVPILRPFHLLGFIRRSKFFQSGSGTSFRLLLVIYASLAAALFVYTISLAVLEVERTAPNANILTLGDSLWWAAATVSTVGYGDVYPVTTPGRLLAVVLMAGGVAIVGIATATVVSWLAENIRERAEAHHRGPIRQAPTERADAAQAGAVAGKATPKRPAATRTPRTAKSK